MSSRGRTAAARPVAPWRSRAAQYGRRAANSAPVRYLVAHPDLAAAIALGLLVLAYLWPALLGGKILSPISVLYGATPWLAYEPPDLQAYYNPLLSDVPMADYPWRWLARGLIHDGVFPAWNPHVFGGIPLFSNPQVGLFTPFNIPLWILPLNWALGFSAAIKLWFAGFGTYLLARQLRLGFLPGLLGGVVFAFCSLNITWLTHETLPAVCVLLPWVVLLIERIYAHGRLSSALWLAGAAAVGLGGGHPGMQVHLLAVAALYALVRVWLVPDLDRREQVRRLALVGGGLLFGVLLMAVMLVPELLSTRGTLGTQAREAGRSTMPGSTMPLDAIKTTLFPDWWGRPSAVEIPGDRDGAGWLVNYNERTFYAGVVGAMLACVGLLTRGGWRIKAPFLLLGFLGLAIPLHLPGLWWAVTHLPVFEMVQNQRIHFIYEFSVAILAAFGLQAVLDRPDGDRWRLAVPIGALLIGFAAFPATGASLGDVGRLVDHFATGTDYAVGEMLALTSVAWFALFAVGVLAALIAAIRWPRRSAVIAVAIVALAVVDMLHFADGYQPMGPAAKVIPPRTPAIRYLQQRADEGRFFATSLTFTNDWSTTYGLRDVRGYDPPNPTLRLFRLWRMANPLQIDWTPFTIDAIGPSAVKLVNVLGARYIATEPGAGDLDRGDPTLRRLRRVYDGEDATIFLNPGAVPRVMLPSRIEAATDEAAARGLLMSDDFDAPRTVVVERDERAAARLAGAPAARGEVRVVSDENARVTLRATLDRPGLVVLNDSLTDGWTVTVDGQEAEPVRVNSVMRGVTVKSGDHEVVWSYAVPGLKLGALVSLAALMAIAGTALVLAVRARRRRHGNTTMGDQGHGDG